VLIVVEKFSNFTCADPLKS